MNSDLQALLQSFLNALEREEARLLAWGVVDGAFTEDEVLDIADRVLYEASADSTPEQLMEEAGRYGLLFEFPSDTTATDSDRNVYRTRMAETVRLLARLRQLGPNRAWRAAPSLVADYRFTVRPRAYPVRDRTPQSVHDEIAQAARLHPIQVEALNALVQTPKGPLSLSDFQVKAAANILRDLSTRQRNSRGTIVGAGTGSGKTLAFYLPAFLHITQKITETPNEKWVKAVALYPRSELLKDQLSGAVASARKLDGVLGRHRPISIGAYYGDTPYRANHRFVEWKWARSESGDGFVCPYLRGPNGEELTWLDEDIEAERERLVGQTTDGAPIVYGPDMVRLTRASCVSSPPDIVFTTTEMMNRLMSNGGDRRVIGLHDKYRVQRPPELVLLDEAHTYNGLTGAHTAYLLRRWRKALGGRPQFVGLSATLVGAQDFFARLVGIKPASVVEITPREDALVQEGAEYLIALRGDPGTGTSLLSTSIQAAMLIGRALDPAHTDHSGGLYGRRTFAFTDNLDVTNRFYHALLSAEGKGRKGVPLAETRSHDKPEPDARLRAGQNWLMAEDIGHQYLNIPLRVGITSSQAAGVDANADVVIATSSLEVGFDDPLVGAVLQHKAPLDSASFLQRKGRAGRKREMRPWTLVVLSDYGRDRAAYQAYDALFDPSLLEQNLPTANRYVLRIQAGFAFMDWLTDQMCREEVGDYPDNIWKDLAYPARHEKSNRGRRKERQQWIQDRITRLLNHGTDLPALSNYLAGALGVDEDEIAALLWEPPRALMTALLPTLLRRIKHQWRQWRPDALPGERPDEPFSRDPLPDFLPANFFTDLNLPEVDVVIPPHHGREAEEHPMSIRQALAEFAPGRVSRRFGVRHEQDAFWVPLNLDNPSDNQLLDLASFIPAHEPFGTVHVREGNRTTPLRSVRPRQIQAALASDRIRSTSNAFMTWASVLRPHPDAEPTPVSDSTGWAGLIPHIAFNLHQDDTPADIARVATGARAEIGFVSAQLDDRTIHVRFVEGDQPVGIGFLHTFDAVTFDLTLPQALGDDPPDPHTAGGRALRVAYIHHLVATSPDLDGVANSFARAWLSEALVSSLILVAAESGDTGDNALRNSADAIWDDSKGKSPFTSALEEVMAAAALDADDDDDAERQGHARVHTLLSEPAVRPVLDSAAASLWATGVGSEYRDWIRNRYRSTVGGALLQAVYALCPEIGGADLYLDLDGGPCSPGEPARDHIWISESAVGGTGLLETFAQRYAADPRRFFRLADGALAASDAEQVDVELGRILSLADSNTDVSDALAAVRGASGLRDLREHTTGLRRLLGRRGVLCTHPVFAALQARILRPGASPASDDLLLRLVQAWRRMEADLGIEVDARGFALWAARRSEFESDLDALVDGVASPSQRFDILYGLVWPRGRGVRARALGSYNPFVQLPEADRFLVADLVDAIPTVALDDTHWKAHLREALRGRGAVRLVAPLGGEEGLAEATLSLALEPLDMGFLLLYPVIDGFERDTEHVVARLSLPESIQ